jgi:transcriptional regulator with XRE-family HTH domain
MAAGKDFQATLAHRLRLLREKAGWTQDQLAAAIGIEGQASQVSRYENGKTAVTLQYLVRIAAVFKVPLHELLTFSGDVASPTPAPRPPKTRRPLTTQKEEIEILRLYRLMAPKYRKVVPGLLADLGGLDRRPPRASSKRRTGTT